MGLKYKTDLNCSEKFEYEFKRFQLTDSTLFKTDLVVWKFKFLKPYIIKQKIKKKIKFKMNYY